MTKRELELEVARLRGQIEVLERELSAARVGGVTVPIWAPSYPQTWPQVWYGSSSQAAPPMDGTCVYGGTNHG